ncbi:Trans-aconitate 3-methyltransferase [Spathaspora sp. JA1]|nr:Trans-aconitate 3-methyltransferase [Spathaspora sp. JA1]
MTTFSKANFKTLQYNTFRPQYPSSFYSILSNYVAKPLPLTNAIDLGCGTGVATYPLLNISSNVIGVDLSPSMVNTANSLMSSRLQELGGDSKFNIKFIAGAVEEFVKEDSELLGQVDLITAGQCIHWFQDYDSFFANAAKLLAPGGVLAYFYYIDPIIVNFSNAGENKAEIINKAHEIYMKYAYDDPKLMGPHWEQPGRDILKHFCASVNEHIPNDLYTDVTINTFVPSVNKPFADEPVDLDLKKTGIKLQGYVDYLTTYSGLHNYIEATGDTKFLDRFLQELEQATGWNRDTTVLDLVWNTGYTFIRKK